jgi:hypothetical protein
MKRLWSARGQASIELLGAIPAVVVAALLVFQLLAVGAVAVLAGGAAEAGALALATGGDPVAAAIRAVPGWERSRMDVHAEGGEVRVDLRPPSPIPGLSDRLEVTSSAWARAPEG